MKVEKANVHYFGKIFVIGEFLRAASNYINFILVI